MAQHDIYLYGDIYNEQSEMTKAFGVVSMSSVLSQLNLAKKENADELVVHIHSRGGDVNEGFAIHDLLVSSGFRITTIVEGLCASIASVIALAGTERKMMANSEFFIHNPWADPSTMSGFTADDYAKRAADIKVAEDKLLNFYVAKTGGDKETIANMMKVETSLTAEQALEMKFITDIVQTINAKAYLPTKNKFHEMKEVSTIKNALNRVLSFLDGNSSNVVALDLTLEDGTPIVVETEESTIKVGDAVTINGEPAPDGEHMLSDGSKIVVAGGKIAEIYAPEMAASSDEPSADAEVIEANKQLIADNATLKLNNAQLNAENETLKKDISELTKQVSEIQSRIKNLSSGFVPQGRTGDAGARGTESMDDVASRVAARKKSILDNKK